MGRYGRDTDRWIDEQQGKADWATRGEREAQVEQADELTPEEAAEEQAWMERMEALHSDPDFKG